MLYAGVGRGQEAVEAAALGARVSGLDRAPAMLRRLRRCLAARGLSAELVEGDLFTFEAASGGYDHVVAHFFLNVFPHETMREALALLAGCVAPGGRLVVSDFAAGSSAAYYRPVNVAAWLLGLAALHPIYDYVPELEALGFRVTRRDAFGPFESISARRC